MRIIQEITTLPSAVWGKTPVEIPLEKFKVPFSFEDSKKKEKPKEQKKRGRFDPPGPITKEQLKRLNAQIAEHQWKTRIGANNLNGE